MTQLVWKDEGPDKFSWSAPAESNDNTDRFIIAEYLVVELEDDKILVGTGFEEDAVVSNQAEYVAFCQALKTCALKLGWEES